MSNLAWVIGKVRITSILDTENRFPIRGLFPMATAAALAPHIGWLVPHFLDERGYCTLSMHALVIESSGKKIVVDTGWGEHTLPGNEQFVGSKSFLEDLANAGFPRESVDLVICTHLHIDHVGRNTMRSGPRWVPTFPNARYIFARKEWEHWVAAEDRLWAGNFNEAVQPVVAAGLADLVDMNHQITDEVRLEPTPGHTPGHVSVHISSGGNRAMIIGDVSHHPVQWAEPDWSISGDSDSVMAAQTRRRLLEQYIDTRVLFIGSHYASPCAGYLVSDEKRTQFRAERP
ncbi:MAG: MBL fold metallo-hydrolase [Dehalococcoidia bacterium]